MELFEALSFANEIRSGTLMDIRQVLALFDREVRASPVAFAGLQVEHIHGIVCLTGIFNFVSYWSLPAAETIEVVNKVAERFRSLGLTLIWRVYQHDQPENLSRALAAAGFENTSSGALMFFDATSDLGVTNHVCEIRRVDTSGRLDDYFRVSALVFEEEQDLQNRDAFARRLGDPDHQLFVAYVDQQPVASARLEIVRSFGQLFGGGVMPGFRGRGIYRALVAARLTAARERGASYLCTEAGALSRPVLEGLGFEIASLETTWVLPASSGNR